MKLPDLVLAFYGLCVVANIAKWLFNEWRWRTLPPEKQDVVIEALADEHGLPWLNRLEVASAFAKRWPDRVYGAAADLSCDRYFEMIESIGREP